MLKKKNREHFNKMYRKAYHIIYEITFAFKYKTGDPKFKFLLVICFLYVIFCFYFQILK